MPHEAGYSESTCVSSLDPKRYVIMQLMLLQLLSPASDHIAPLAI